MLQSRLVGGNATVGVSEDPSRAQRPNPDGGILPKAPCGVGVGKYENLLQQALFRFKRWCAARHPSLVVCMLNTLPWTKSIFPVQPLRGWRMLDKLSNLAKSAILYYDSQLELLNWS